MKNSLLFVFVFCAAFANAQYGTIDNTFGVATQSFSQADIVSQTLIQSDGKILVLGSTTDPSGTVADAVIMRYNTNGTLDTTFSNNGFVEIDYNSQLNYGKAMALYSNGKILVAGHSDSDVFLFRLNANGSLDNTFGTNGSTVVELLSTQEEIFDVEIMSDGKILVAGHIDDGNTIDFLVGRFNADGTLDTTFATSSGITAGLAGLSFNDIDYGKSVSYDVNGNIYISGSTYRQNKGYNVAICKISADGSTYDANFGTNGRTEFAVATTHDEFESMILQADGSILLAGTSGARCGMAKLNANGLVDSSFATDGRFVYDPTIHNGNSGISEIQVQADGKIIAGGYSTRVNNYNQFTVLQLNANGTLDTFFHAFSDPVHHFLTSIALQTDGKIVATGSVSMGSSTSFLTTRFLTAAPIVSTTLQTQPAKTINIYPNPATTQLTIAVEEPTFISIYNVMGQVVATQNLQATQIIDISRFEAGVYFVEANNGQTLKFVKL